MNTHTPGPWSWDRQILVRYFQPGEPGSPEDWEDVVLSTLDDVELAKDFIEGGGREYCNWSVNEANARLIAAAPDLLAALKKARAEFAGLPHSLGYDFTHLPEIDAAIAKAEGKA